MNIENAPLPFHSMDGNSIWRQLWRKTWIQIERITSEPVARQAVCENLQEAAVTCQKAEGRVRAAVHGVYVNRLFRELIEWEAKLIVSHNNGGNYIWSTSCEKIRK